MSAKATFWAWEQDVDATQQHVLLALANFANDEGELWYSYQKIANATKLNRKTVIRACMAMEGKMLTITRRQKTPSTNDTNLFKLNIGEVTWGRDTKSPGVGTQSPQGRDTESLSSEPNNEPNKKDIPPTPKGGEQSVSKKFEDWWKLLPAACRSRANKAKTQSMWKRKACEAIADDIILKTKARLDRRSGDINWIKSHGKYVPGAHIILRDALWDGEWYNPIADIDIVALVATWNDLAASHPMLCTASADDDALFDAVESTVTCLPDRLINEDYDIYFNHIASKSSTFKKPWTLTGVLRPDFLQRALAELRGAA